MLSLFRQRSTVAGAIGYLLLELAIVFVGVFAAFQLSLSAERQEDDLLRRQLADALRREVESALANTRHVADFLPKQVQQYEDAIADGERPRLQPLMEPIRARMHMWQVVKQNSGLELLGVPLMYQATVFFSDLDMGFEQFDQLRELSETVLLPNLDAPLSEFYDEDGSLRPKYQWYLAGMKRLASLAERGTRRGDALVVKLHAIAEGAEGERELEAESAGQATGEQNG